LIKTTQHNSDEHTHETKTLEGTMVDKLVVAPELLLIDVERASVRYGRSYVDNASAISETLATTMFSKAILLEVTTVGEDDGLTPWDGQAGLIRGSQITPLPQLRPGGNGGDEYTTAASRWTVFPVTAKHNIESRHEKTGFQRYHGAKMQTAASTPKSVAVSFPDGGWEQEQHGEDARVIGYVDGEPIQSPAGVDFTWGETVVRAHSFMTLKPTSTRSKWCAKILGRSLVKRLESSLRGVHPSPTIRHELLFQLICHDTLVPTIRWAIHSTSKQDRSSLTVNLVFASESVRIQI
jgi:hypothetical protein